MKIVLIVLFNGLVYLIVLKLMLLGSMEAFDVFGSLTASLFVLFLFLITVFILLLMKTHLLLGISLSFMLALL